MASLIKPAELLMSRLRFSTKFTLISVLFLIPLLLTTVVLIQKELLVIGQLSAEHQGMQAMSSTVDLIGQLSEHRRVSWSFINGKEEEKSSLLKIEGELDKGILSIDKTLETEKRSVEFTVDFKKILSQWDFLKVTSFEDYVDGELAYAIKAHGKTKAIYDAHTDLISRLIQKLKEVRVSYKLNEDAKFETSLIAELSSEKLPSLFDIAGQLRTLTSAVSTAGRVTPENHTRLSGLVDQVMVLTKDLDAQFALAKRFGDDDFQTEVETFVSALKSLVVFSELVKTQLITPDSINVKSTVLMNEGSKAVQQLTDAYRALGEYAMHALHKRNVVEKRLLFLVVGLMSLTLFIAFYLFVGFYSAVANTVKDLRNVSRRLAAGDLTTRIEPKTKDELRQIAVSFNEVSAAFEEIIAKTKVSMREVDGAVALINEVSRETLSGVDEQKAQMDGMVTAMNEMTASAQEVERNTVEAAEEAKLADRESRKGEDVVRAVIDKITSLAHEVMRTSEAMSKLAEGTNKIGAVSDVIRGIAEQTNLLALNAAIEAARAGEQGRGFAVVADEVRTLAQRTSESTDEIQLMISQLQSASQEALEVILRSRIIVDESVDQVSKAGESLKSITAVAGHISDMNGQVASAATEQAATTNEITKNISHISAISDKAAEGASELSTAANQLRELTSSLDTRLSEFQVSQK